MKLYRLTCALGSFYVAAAHPTDAEHRLTDLLTRADYGFFEKRKVTSIELLANEVTDTFNGKPNFSGGNNLILPQSCESLVEQKDNS